MSIDGPQTEHDSGDVYQYILHKTERMHRLFSVHWELTYRCNQTCSHCYLDVLPPNGASSAAPAASAGPAELSTAECLQVIDQIAELGALNLTLSGGDILVRRDLFEIAAYARSKGLLLRLFTNGTLITPRVADRIATLHPYSVEISLYSAEAAVHDGITRLPRSWELSVRAVRLLRQRGVRVQLKTPLMRENVNAIPALRRLADELGAGFRLAYTITPKDGGALDPLAHRVDYAGLVAYLRDNIEPKLWLNRQVDADARPCGIAARALVIDPYGNVMPCMEVRRRLGNLRRQSLQEIWETSPAWRELAALTRNRLPTCADCSLRNLCFRCHGLAQREGGDLIGPSPANCMEALARRQALIERGDLPLDTPVPEHLQAMLDKIKTPVTVS